MIFLAKSDIGRVRTTNQDSFAVEQLSNGYVLAVVCDGMGGAKGGSIASNTAVEVISRKIIESFKDETVQGHDEKGILESALVAANEKIFNISSGDSNLKGMGTTAVIALVSDDIAHIMHVGDSRAYHLHKDGITRLTRDHSIVQELVETGELTESEAKTHPKKNIITQALGVEKEVQFDYCKVNLEKDDVILLCTDGLTNYVEDKQIYKCYNELSIFEIPDKLIELANQGGGGDNITIAVIY